MSCFRFSTSAAADNASSSLFWNQTIFTQAKYTVSSLIQTSDGGYAMSGTANGTLGFLIKTEADGSIEWSKTYEEMNYTQVNSLIQTNDEVTF